MSKKFIHLFAASQQSWLFSSLGIMYNIVKYKNNCVGHEKSTTEIDFYLHLIFLYPTCVPRFMLFVCRSKCNTKLWLKLLPCYKFFCLHTVPWLCNQRNHLEILVQMASLSEVDCSLLGLSQVVRISIFFNFPLWAHSQRPPTNEKYPLHTIPRKISHSATEERRERPQLWRKSWCDPRESK